MNDIAKTARATVKEDRPLLPEFETEEEAREFWATHDSTDYLDQTEDVTATPPPELRTGPGRAGSRARKRPPCRTDGPYFSALPHRDDRSGQRDRRSTAPPLPNTHAIVGW